mmetsp:Transcript_81484/g.143902  ORF Transcript_81484/g.143902 Transcript_81484/m.143902 type:complete len:189 (+) Transcript_81484:81-647(+)
MAKEDFSQLVSAHISDLSDRLAACEAQVGRLKPAYGARGVSSVQARVKELQRRVDEIYNRERKLPELERGVDALDEWLKAEHADASHVLLHRSAKRNFVVQHTDQLLDFAHSLKEVDACRQFINPPSLRELPSYAERLRAAEAKGTLAVGSAMQLHEQVGKLAEDYHHTMTSLNEQLLRWDALLSEKK